MKNLITLNEKLSDLNLDFIWEKRFEYISLINNIDPTLNIRLDENYINE
jgi:hypothetical protein